MIKPVLTAAFVLLAAASAWTLLLPAKSQVVGREGPATKPSPTAGDEAPTTAPQMIRVVYPGPDMSETNNTSVARVGPGVPAGGVAPVPPSAVTAAAVTPVREPRSEVARPDAEGTTASADAVAHAAANQAVDLNTASIETMDHLDGAGRIGLAIARHRPYRSVEDLLSKRVVRRSVYEKIRLQVVTQ